MFPLLLRDGHMITYATLQFLFVWHSLTVSRSRLNPTSVDRRRDSTNVDDCQSASTIARRIVRISENYPIACYRIVQVRGGNSTHVEYSFERNISAHFALGSFFFANLFFLSVVPLFSNSVPYLQFCLSATLTLSRPPHNDQCCIFSGTLHHILYHYHHTTMVATDR